MEKSKTVIVGQGLLGKELEVFIQERDDSVTVLKKVTLGQKKLIPDGTENIIIVAQSSDYRKEFITSDLFYVNTALPVQIIQQAIDAGVKKFAYCSTGSVYNKSSQPHKEEETLQDGPMTPYVATKRAAEILISSWHKHFERLVIFRPFFIYGSNQPESRLFSNIISNLKNGSVIKLANGKGLVFNPIHVYDAAKFTWFALQHGKGFDVYNMAGPQIVTLADVVDEISKLLSVRPNIDNMNSMEDVIIGDINKMMLTGFKHEMDIRNGIKEMIFGKNSS